MKMIIQAIFLLALAACASSSKHIDAMLGEGDFASAYQYVVLWEGRTNDRLKLASEIKLHPAGYTNVKFFQSTQKIFRNSSKTEKNFLEFWRLVDLVYDDKLITHEQATNLRYELIYHIEESALLDDKIRNSIRLRESIPELSNPSLRIASFDYMLTRLNTAPDIKLSDLSSHFKFAEKEVNREYSSKLLTIANSIAAREVSTFTTNKNKVTWDAVLPIIVYSNFSKNAELKQSVREVLSKVEYKKSNLNSPELIAFDAEFAKSELNRRTRKIKLVIEPDDGAFYDDFQKIITRKNEWVEFDDDSQVVLLIKKQRFIENLGSPLVGSEIVSDPSFATLLLIPRNASVLFDHVTTEYRIDYSLDVSFSTLKSRKNFRGSDSAKRVECRNARYQNVFGGTGSIGWNINDRVQMFCTQASTITFNNLRMSVMEDISSEINDYFLRGAVFN